MVIIHMACQKSRIYKHATSKSHQKADICKAKCPVEAAIPKQVAEDRGTTTILFRMAYIKQNTVDHTLI